MTNATESVAAYLHAKHQGFCTASPSTSTFKVGFSSPKGSLRTCANRELVPFGGGQKRLIRANGGGGVCVYLRMMHLFCRSFFSGRIATRGMLEERESWTCITKAGFVM